MMLTKAFVLLVLALVYARGSPLHEGSEKMPPKSEIVLRIKRLLLMLREKERESVGAGQEPRPPKHHSLISDRRKMIDRRRKLEAFLKGNPGLRTLLKSVLAKRKAEESQNDAQDCLPGLFYCRDESENHIDKSAKRRQELKKIMHMKKQDASPYCPPGFFYCPNSDDAVASQKKKDRLDLLNELFPERRDQHHQNTKEMEDLDRVVKLAKKQRESKRKDVQFIRVPSSVTKEEESDEAAKGKSTHGEKLADDLVKSLQDTGKKTNDKTVEDKKSNFDLKQLMELLKE